MKRLLSVIRFDLANARRDSLILYILAAPVILALGLRLFAPSVSTGIPVMAVDVSGEGGEAVAESLEAYARVERMPGRKEVERRVRERDEAAGVLWSPGKDEPWLLLAGDEDDADVIRYSAVMAAVTAGNPVAMGETLRIQANSPVLEYGRVFLALLSVLFGGIAAAFALVEEKECKETRAFAVTSLSPFEYFAARGVWAALAGAIGVWVGHAIAGGSGASLWRLAAATGASALLPLAACLLIGGIAANQIQAIASLKVVLLVYLTLPLASVFVPSPWKALFWVLPNYWAFEAFKGVYIPGTSGFGLALAMSAGLGSALVVVAGIVLAPRLSPRRAA